MMTRTVLRASPVRILTAIWSAMIKPTTPRNSIPDVVNPMYGVADTSMMNANTKFRSDLGLRYLKAESIFPSKYSP
jgi:hypothetical protein